MGHLRNRLTRKLEIPKMISNNYLFRENFNFGFIKKFQLLTKYIIESQRA